MRAALLLVVVLGCFSARAGSAYREPILFQWDTLQIDVLIVPPLHGQLYNDGGVLPAGSPDAQPISNSYLGAVERGIAMWRKAIVSAGPAWLQGLRIRSYVLGRDAIPSDALADPEIVVTHDETMGPVLGTSYPSHPCPAVVSSAYHVSFTANDVQTLAAHEVGHCLGLGHIDGFDPAEDLMQAVYRFPDGLQSTPVECPSTLNVAALTSIFAAAAGRSGGGGPAQVSPADYAPLC